MKKIILAVLVSACALSSAFAQGFDFENTKRNALPSPDQVPFQQLIGYAIEVSSEAFSNKIPVGSYKCEKIYSTEGYNELSKYPCELFVHSKQGPIVVRYQNVPDAMDKDIKKFLSENPQLGLSLYYNKGRFRFEVEEESEKSEEEE